MDDRLEDMMRDIGEDSFKRAHVLKLFNLKAKNGWTDKSFTELLELLTQMLPEGNIMPNRHYKAKKVLCPMGLEYEKCKASRYKKKDVDSSDDEVTNKNLRWHAEERKCDGQIRHVADSLQWKKIDSLFPNFGKESKNLRLGFAADGMNRFGNQSTNHSSWHVLLMIYNLSPWLCMKRKYIMLSMMISGPKQPGNDIDVYLSPLIDDLRVLWEEGVDVLDAYSGEQFNMRAMLFCTINDFPAYGNLSGYTVKGHLALRKAFNGDQENDVAPTPLTEEEVYEQQWTINVVIGKYQKPKAKVTKAKRESSKSQKQPAVKNVWKKRSVFFDLPYWSSLDVRHCIDVMQVEKNVCDSVIGTLLNIKGKTKDSANARLDMSLIQKLVMLLVLDHFVIPEDCVDEKKNRLKKAWNTYTGDRWKDFKSRLTLKYTTNPQPNSTPPYIKYNYIKQDVWEEFVKSRDTPEFKVLSKSSDGDRSISLLERHETWSRARMKKGGGFTSKACEQVVDKIECLVEEKNKGVFVPDGRNDILTEAIGTPEHGGRVRGVGKKHNISTFFKRSKVSRQRQDIDVKEQIAELEAKVEKKLVEERKLMQEEMMNTLRSMGLSQTSATSNKVIEPELQNDKLVVTGSAKGSCSAASVMKAQNDERNVDFDDVKKLLMMVLTMYDNHLEFSLTHCSGAVNFHVSAKCIRELLVGDQWLDLSILQVWCTYIHRLSIANNTSEVYGILDPPECTIIVNGRAANQKTSQKRFIVINNTHAYRGHWQLIILCPTIDTVAVLCSLHRDLHETMKKIVSSAFTVDQLARGNRKNATTWLYPTTRK
ncbi:hypothetical protein TSUD_173080 [Trifolium subterraneum]|nr:hypothetical protein TSUD_173080 [Trifolium subterraneum]